MRGFFFWACFGRPFGRRPSAEPCALHMGVRPVLRTKQQGRARFASEGGGPNEDRPDPPPANQMMNWLFKYYVTALPGGSAPPP